MRGARDERIEERLARRGGSVELLRLPAALFGAIVRARAAAYDHGILPRARLAVPVVSVGNLTTGGTGKTPFCAWLVAELARRGFRPGLLSRGYRAPEDARRSPVAVGEDEDRSGPRASTPVEHAREATAAAGSDSSVTRLVERSGSRAPNDEAELLARLCPGVPHVQDPDRVRGGRELVAAGVDVIVLDDGFQHRRLARDLEFVLVDATRPWGLPAPAGGGEPVRALLPRGLLREPLSALARADAIVVTRTDEIGEDALRALEREIERRAPGKPVARAVHRARALRDERGRERPVASLAGRDVVLASAIGNPQAFESQVRAAGARVREHRVFADHHRYVARDLDGLVRDGELFVTTAKDAVKLAPIGLAFEALEIELALVAGLTVVEALLDALPRAGAPPVRLVAPRKLRD